MKIIITGGAGFIGSNAAHYFLRKGCEVIIFDNLSRDGAEKNIQWLSSLGGKLQIIKGEIKAVQDVALLQPYMQTADAVIHLAAQVAVTSSVQHPKKDFEINAAGTLNLLELVRKTKSKTKFIYTSTNKVYGGLDHIEIQEQQTRYAYTHMPYGISEATPLDFHSPYGCSKGAADQYVHDYARIYDMDTVVLRQSCIYGPRQFGVEDQGWVAWFIIATMLGKTLTVYGDGKQVRDILYVEDLIEFFDLVIQKKEITRGKIYNVGGGIDNTISVWREFGSLLEELFGITIPVRFSGWRPGDQKIYISDIRKATKELNWKPKTSLRSGITKTYQWVLANKNLFEPPTI